jgi:L-fucose isomerase-like protein
MQINNGKTILKTYSSDKTFIDSLKLIAHTSSSGTVIFLWIFDATKNMREQPVVIFGDEGGFDVLFENVRDLLHYLSFNSAMYNADELSFVDDTYVSNPRVTEYATWLKENFNLDVITAEESEELCLKAQKKYGVLFENWMKHFVA